MELIVGYLEANVTIPLHTKSNKLIKLKRECAKKADFLSFFL